MHTQAQQLDWSGALAAIGQANSVLLVAHVTPDADALGSALAIGLACESLGKNVQISVGEPGFKVPESLKFLPRTDLVVAPESITNPDLVIICDTASVARLGVLAQVVQNASTSIVLDHHPSFNGFGTIHLVDSSAAATAAIAMELIEKLGVELTKDIATTLYAGLATDTGSFKFQATTAQTLRIAAKLFEAGIDHAQLARQLFDDEPFDALVMLGEALQRAELDQKAVNGRGLAYTSIAINQRHGLSELAMERVIEAIRRATEAEVAAVFKQADDKNWKVSLRSKTNVDVGKVATQLGGGGHYFASGYTSGTDLSEAILELKNQLNAQDV